MARGYFRKPNRRATDEDVVNAKAFMQAFGSVIRYVPSRDHGPHATGWFIKNGDQWFEDNGYTDRIGVAVVTLKKIGKRANFSPSLYWIIELAKPMMIGDDPGDVPAVF